MHNKESEARVVHTKETTPQQADAMHEIRQPCVATPRNAHTVTCLTCHQLARAVLARGVVARVSIGPKLNL